MKRYICRCNVLKLHECCIWGGKESKMTTGFKPGDDLWFTSFLSDCTSLMYLAVPQLNKVTLICLLSLASPQHPLYFLPYVPSFLMASAVISLWMIPTSLPHVDLFLSLWSFISVAYYTVALGCYHVMIIVLVQS